MTDVYKGKLLRNDDLFAVWKSDDGDTIHFFIPSFRNEAYFTCPTSEWESCRADYLARNEHDLASYEDIANAAWHRLGQSLHFVNRRTVVRSTVPPGLYYPRIWRGYQPPSDPYDSYNAVDPREQYGYQYTQSVVATASLFDQLVEIFRHVEPSQSNYQTYSHKIRELLLLACTEIESQWRTVLEENTRRDNWRERYTTVDYVRLKETLRLDDWAVILVDYAHLGEFKPFAGWSETAPTKTLAWYDAYNAVKHHREAEFSKATFEALLLAMAALHIMQVAQWGPEVFSRWHEDRFSPFAVVTAPVIDLAEVYIPGLDESRSLSPGLYFER